MSTNSGNYKCKDCGKLTPFGCGICFKDEETGKLIQLNELMKIYTEGHKCQYFESKYKM